MPSKRYRLKLATWIVVRDAEAPSPRVLNHPDDVARLAMEFVKTSDDDKEHFWVVLTNTRHHYLMHSEVSVGSQTASLVHPREVFGPAVREGVHSIVLAHNHPSGDPAPSAEDRSLTTRLKDCGTLLGIELLDHVIVGNGTGRWFSFRDAGML
jgi:DNA repair protein RadC